jgi:hypothetical protein
MHVAPLVIAVAAALTITAAPSASASTNAQCRESGGGRICQRPGHSFLHSEPRVSYPSGSMFHGAWMPGFGRGFAIATVR